MDDFRMWLVFVLAGWIVRLCPESPEGEIWLRAIGDANDVSLRFMKLGR